MRELLEQENESEEHGVTAFTKVPRCGNGGGGARALRARWSSVSVGGSYWVRKGSSGRRLRAYVGEGEGGKVALASGAPAVAVTALSDGSR